MKSKRIFKDELSLSAVVMFCVAMVLYLVRSIRLILDDFYIEYQVIYLLLFCTANFLMIIYAAKEYKTDKKSRCLSVAMLFMIFHYCINIMSYITTGVFSIQGFMLNIVVNVFEMVPYLFVLYGSVKKFKRISIPNVVLLLFVIFSAFSIVNNGLSYSRNIEYQIEAGYDYADLIFSMITVALNGFSVMFMMVGMLLITIRGLKKIPAPAKAIDNPVKDELLLLNQQYSQGLISLEEFTARRAEILNRLYQM